MQEITRNSYSLYKRETGHADEKMTDLYAFKAWRRAYYRTVSGELKTNRALDAAREAAVIKAGNAYIKLRQQG
jgi:hypothetical protein